MAPVPVTIIRTAWPERVGETGMGLSAAVYCDCFERGELRVPPQPEWEVFISEDGSRETTAKELDVVLAFDRWSDREACEHRDNELICRPIGNIAHLGFLRRVLKRYPQQFDLLLRKLLGYEDPWIAPEVVERMQPEVERLARLHLSSQQDEADIREFEQSIRELVECSLRVRKPITLL